MTNESAPGEEGPTKPTMMSNEPEAPQAVTDLDLMPLPKRSWAAGMSATSGPVGDSLEEVEMVEKRIETDHASVKSDDHIIEAVQATGDVRDDLLTPAASSAEGGTVTTADLEANKIKSSKEQSTTGEKASQPATSSTEIAEAVKRDQDDKGDPDEA